MSLQPRNRCDAATLTPPRLLPKNVIDGALELASRFAEARVNGGDRRLVGGESLVEDIGLAQRLRGRRPSLHGPRGDEAARVEGGLDLRGVEAGGLAVIGLRRLVEERGGDSVGPEPPILAEPDQNAHDLVRGPPRQVALAHERPRQIRGRRPVTPGPLAHLLLANDQRGEELAEPVEIARAVVADPPERLERVVALGDG